MKKLISIMVSFILVFMVGAVYAADEDPEIKLNFTETVQLQEGEKEVVLNLSIDSIKNIPDDASIGYQANVKYDKNIFESIKIEKTREDSKWDQINYNETTGVLICELGSGNSISANKDIAKFTLTLKEGVETGETKVELSGEDAVVTVQAGEIGTGFDYSTIYEATATIGIKGPKTPTNPSSNEEEPTKQEEPTTPKQTQQQETKQQTQTITPQVQSAQSTTQAGKEQTTNKAENTKTDTTTAKTTMPKTGVKTIFVMLIIIAIISGIYLIRYKSIQIK